MKRFLVIVGVGIVSGVTGGVTGIFAEDTLNLIKGSPKPDVRTTLIYQENKGYILNVKNQGEGISHNLKIDLGFKGTITEIGSMRENRVEIIEGGEHANFVSFKIAELLAGEQQYLSITTTRKGLQDVNLNSESEGDLSGKLVTGEINIRFGPEESVDERQSE